MASTKESTRTKTGKADAPTKAPRQGAKFKKLLAQMNLSKTKEAEAVTRAEEIAVEEGMKILDRPDGILRDYYLYLATDTEMPARVKSEWEHFQTTGRELVGGTRTKADSNGGSTGGRDRKAAKPDPKKPRGAKGAAKETETPETDSDAS